MLATVTMGIEPAQSFSMNFSAGISQKTEAAIGNAVLSVLLSQDIAAILGCNVEVESVVEDPIHSSDAAFFVAAKEATEKLIGIAPGFERNIRW